MKNRKSFKLLLLALLVFAFGSYLVLADTGFDIDYDIGGGFDFGGGGGGGFDIGFGDSHSSSNSTYSAFIFILFLIILAVDVIRRRTGKGLDEDLKDVKQGDNSKICYVWYDEVERTIPNFDRKEFNKMASDMYIKLQEAWMNFDYETIRSLTTDDLYNSYKTMLESLEKKNQRNIIEDIKIYSCIFSNVKNQNGKYSIDAKFDLALKDYIVNKGSIVIARGQNVRLDVECIVTFVSTEKSATTKCPTCGAPISKKNQSDKCKFCGSTIVKENYSWVISKKKVTKQKVIGD